MNEKSVRNVEKFIGLAASLILIVGVMSLVGAVIAFLGGDTLAGSLSLLASALALGLFLTAILNA